MNSSLCREQQTDKQPQYFTIPARHAVSGGSYIT